MADRFFARHGSKAILIGRMLPLIRTFIAFPAGVAHMPLGRFHLYTFIGSWPWCFGLTWIGMKLGKAWNSDPRYKEILHSFDAFILLALVAGGAWFIWHKRKARG
jgi:membrane protein DedA with SNARE-associated domain